MSDHEAIETNWPGPESVPRYSGLDLDLEHLYSEPLFRFLVTNPPGKAELLTSDPCLQRPASGPFFVHIKAGTRVYEAYTLLDQAGAETGTFAARLNAELCRNTRGRSLRRSLGVCDTGRRRWSDRIRRIDHGYARRRLPAAAHFGQRGGGASRDRWRRRTTG